METIPESYRNMGIGGTNRFEELEGFVNSGLMVSIRKKVDVLKNRTIIQTESFNSVEETKNEWKREMEYLPMISPVNVIYRLGDGIRFREIHPVLGTPQWHHGQDFTTPYGTEVFARITSYNVCYTKLLRPVSLSRIKAFTNALVSS